MQDQRSSSLPDYDSASQSLSGHDGLFGIADGHGLLCGLLCANPGLTAEEWLQLVFNGPAPSIDTDVLIQLYDRTAARLQGDRLDFTPLLPDDDEPLEKRVVELGRWCQGYLTGLGLGGIDSTQLTPESEEFLHDIAQIAHATLSSDEGEAGERDFAELVEYLRVGVILVRDTVDTDQKSPSARSST